MDVARAAVQQGDTTSIVLADEQTSGRGRLNRPWLTFPAPYGMAATFIVPGGPYPHLPLIAALALHQAVLGLQPETQNPTPEILIKWPNDLLLSGKKAAGILCETISSGAGAPAALVGIGCNIAAPAYVPESFQGTFLGLSTTPEALARAISTCMQALLTLYQQQGWSDTLHNSYLQSCATLGQNLTWQRGTPQQLTGYARSLTKDGHLELVAEDGTVHVIHSGEIFDTR